MRPRYVPLVRHQKHCHAPRRSTLLVEAADVLGEGYRAVIPRHLDDDGVAIVVADGLAFLEWPLAAEAIRRWRRNAIPSAPYTRLSVASIPSGHIISSFGCRHPHHAASERSIARIR